MCSDFGHRFSMYQIQKVIVIFKKWNLDQWPRYFLDSGLDVTEFADRDMSNQSAMSKIFTDISYLRVFISPKLSRCLDACLRANGAT